jgi:hypothetical protein
MIDDLQVDEVVEQGSDTGRGNMLGIQPYMRPGDYATQETLFTRLAAYLDAAAKKGWLNPRTTVVFPEYLGVWIVIAGEKPHIYRETTQMGAARAVLLSNPFSSAKAWFTSGEKDRLAASLFRMKAGDMARIYQAVFSGLAKKYSITLVGGSIVLPAPQVIEGVINAGSGTLHNIAAVFAPDGKAHAALSHKKYITNDEIPFLESASETLPVYDTPAGKLGVIVCADSWFPIPYEQLKTQNVAMLAVVSYAIGKGRWDQPWTGYSGWEAPEDVNRADVGQMTEGQAWRRYALARRIHQSGARCGMNIFLHGDLWDLGGEDGRSLLVDGDTVVETSGKRAALLNLWL